MRCTDCYYAIDRYNSLGQKVGVDCSKDNMRFISFDVAASMYCGAWAERED